MTKGDSNVILTLRGVTIEQDNYVKLLGVNIDKTIILNSMLMRSLGNVDIS